jgi:hypothetical protein
MKLRFRLCGLLCGAFIVSALLAPPEAKACGGFFCSSTPVDQNAERVVFKIRDDGRTDMIVQISYQGKAEDFAWLLPLAEPPKKEDLGTFPQLALTALDSQTSVSVQNPCFRGFADAGVAQAAGGAPPPMSAPSPVQVFVRAEVGNFEVAVIGSTDANATAQWLKDNDFRISDSMQGFIQLYTAEGMKFLALKLLPQKSVNDITPFKLTLPGDTPSIPLRLSAVAAEPEMGIVVWILGSQRYEPANSPELSIDNADLRFDINTGRSNWLALVAREVDEAMGRGFVVEDAQLVEPLLQVAQRSNISTPEQLAAQKALVDLFTNATYLTRLYTRLAPEEMTYDPAFKRSSKGDVSRFRTIPEVANSCSLPVTSDPCAFVACGALGLCRPVTRDGRTVAACACADGATARATFVPSPTSAQGMVTFDNSVSCIDTRLSFLNPGDRNPAGEALPDPCVGVDCSGHGKCVAMNMTATCQCEHGYVAEGVIAADGTRSARCLMPSTPVPEAFYNRRPMPRDTALPVGRADPMPPPTGPSDEDDPVPEGNMTAMDPKSDEPKADPAPESSSSSSGCALRERPAPNSSNATWIGLSLLAAGATLTRRRFRS